MFLVCIRHSILCFIKGELVNLYGFNLVPIESCEWLGEGGLSIPDSALALLQLKRLQTQDWGDRHNHANSASFCLLVTVLLMLDVDFV